MKFFKNVELKMSGLPHLITLRSNPHLYEGIIRNLKMDYVEIPITADTFANGEINIKIGENIREKDVFILQTEANDDMSPNDYLMELLIAIRACKLSSARKITAIIPSFFYARSDKKDVPRVPISSALVCDLLKTAGVDRIVTLDLHAGQIQGMAGTVPFDNLYAIVLFVKYLRKIMTKFVYQKDMNPIFNFDDINSYINEQFVLVSPDAGGVKRVESYASVLGMDYVILHKQRDYTQKNVVHRSMLVGNPEQVKGKIGIVIDDMFDTCGTITKAVEILKESGCRGAWIVATHGIFSEPAFDRLTACNFIEKVIVTNSIPQEGCVEKCLEIVDCSSLFADVIHCLMTGESVSSLFKM